MGGAGAWALVLLRHHRASPSSEQLSETLPTVKGGFVVHQKRADPCYRAYVPILAAPSSGRVETKLHMSG